METGYTLISKSPTKKVFPVEHFGADLRGQNCFPSALQGLKFSKGAAPRRRGAPRHPRAQKVRQPAKKTGSNPGSNPFFSPPRNGFVARGPSKHLFSPKAPLRSALLMSTVGQKKVARAAPKQNPHNNLCGLSRACERLDRPSPSAKILLGPVIWPKIF